MLSWIEAGKVAATESGSLGLRMLPTLNAAMSKPLPIGLERPRPAGLSEMSTPLGDYALIGDCQSCALMARNGSIDWLCLPRFHSASCFAALLGDAGHGRWLLAPMGAVRSTTRRYREGTPVLETVHETDEGTVTVIDFMPVRETTPDLVRIVVGARGTVSMRMELAIRLEYGDIIPWVRPIEGGIPAMGGLIPSA